MLEAAVPSLWTSLYSWCSPTLLFILLNVVIGTIAVSSKAGSRRTEPEEGEQQKLVRAPSAIFGRLRSFKLARQPSIPVDIATLPAFTTETVVVREEQVPSEVPCNGNEEPYLGRSQSDAQPTAGEVLPKLAKKLKKSASSKSAFAHFKEADVVAAATVEEEEAGDEVQEVDARADDFINMFRKQLQLQRLDSLLRYKDMLNRGR